MVEMVNLEYLVNLDRHHRTIYYDRDHLDLLVCQDFQE
jgi:hypothetical protein